MNQTTKDFEFKRFTIIGGKCGMPVSTDGVLLGAWADIQDAKTILDIGTGTGLLALMCAQRSPNSEILAIDIDNDAIQATQHNISSSVWASRIQASQADVTQMSSQRQFECIVCNPPYFNSGEQSRHEQRLKQDIQIHCLIEICCWLANNYLPLKEALVSFFPRSREMILSN